MKIENKLKILSSSIGVQPVSKLELTTRLRPLYPMLIRLLCPELFACFPTQLPFLRLGIDLTENLI